MATLTVKENSGLLFGNGLGKANIEGKEYNLRLNAKKNNVIEFVNDRKELVGEIFMFANKKTESKHPDSRGEGKIEKQTFASCWKHVCKNGNEMLSFAFTTENSVTKFMKALKQSKSKGAAGVDLTDAPL